MANGNMVKEIDVEGKTKLSDMPLIHRARYVDEEEGERKEEEEEEENAINKGRQKKDEARKRNADLLPLGKSEPSPTIC